MRVRSILGVCLIVCLTSLTQIGCSGVSVQNDEPAHPLPPAIERVVVVPDSTWANEDKDAVLFLQKLVAQLRVRSAMHDYGVGFELANPATYEPKNLTPGRDAVWTVSRCDFDTRVSASSRRTSPGAEAAPELEDEARAAAGRLDTETVPGSGAPLRAFSFAVRGFIRSPSTEKVGGGLHPLRVVSRVAVSGDCDFDEAVGSDDEAIWFRESLAKIADAILESLPRRTPEAGEVEEDDADGPIHGGMVPGEPMPGEPPHDTHVLGDFPSPAGDNAKPAGEFPDEK